MEAEEKARSLEQEVSDLKDKAAKAQEELERRLEDAETQIESYHRAQMALLASRSFLGNKLLNPSAPSFVPARAGAVATSLPPAPTASARSATRDTRGTAKPTSRDFPWVTHGISDLDADSAGPLSLYVLSKDLLAHHHSTLRFAGLSCMNCSCQGQVPCCRSFTTLASSTIGRCNTATILISRADATVQYYRTTLHCLSMPLFPSPAVAVFAPHRPGRKRARGRQGVMRP